ncbi:MAG TPA: hypothetical protein VF703_11950 [Pyrinomonadaceae bacterium]
MSSHTARERRRRVSSPAFPARPHGRESERASHIELSRPRSRWQAGRGRPCLQASGYVM